jgi:hypothetical protein
MALPTYRRVAVVALATCLFALTACGSGGNNPTPPNNADPTGQGQLGDEPGASAGATTPAATSTTTTGGGGNQAPSFPNDAKSYGLEILKAIGNKDNARLAALADLNTVNYAQQYQNKNAQWTNTDCSNSTPTTSCNYYNQTGDIASVGMTVAKLGKAGAGVSVYVEGGSYPKDASGYVLAFGSSWESGSYVKMVSLSNSSIADHFKPVAKFSSVNAGITTSAPHPCATNSSKTCVDLQQVGGTANLPIQHLIVDTSKISAGKPNGIVGYEQAT